MGTCYTLALTIASVSFLYHRECDAGARWESGTVRGGFRVFYSDKISFKSLNLFNYFQIWLRNVVRFRSIQDSVPSYMCLALEWKYN